MAIIERYMIFFSLPAFCLVLKKLYRWPWAHRQGTPGSCSVHKKSRGSAEMVQRWQMHSLKRAGRPQIPHRRPAPRWTCQYNGVFFRKSQYIVYHRRYVQSPLGISE